MNLIAAVDKNWAIGLNNKLLVRIPEDQKFFRNTTTGKVVVMGRKTLESFPQGQPLKNRTNIVLTRDKNYQKKDVVIVHSMEQLLEELKQYNSEDIYIIGGESIYRQMVDMCDIAHITKIDFEYMADSWFPNLDEKDEWEITADSEEQTYFDIGIAYIYRYYHITDYYLPALSSPSCLRRRYRLPRSALSCRLLAYVSSCRLCRIPPYR